jgi:hypothetical protein
MIPPVFGITLPFRVEGEGAETNLTWKERRKANEKRS